MLHSSYVVWFAYTKYNSAMKRLSLRSAYRGRITSSRTSVAFPSFSFRSTATYSSSSHSDDELIEQVEKGELQAHNLERLLPEDLVRAVGIRRSEISIYLSRNNK